MAIFTVHQPPPRKYEDEPDPLRFAFVRDGFHFWAFLFGPLWMLRHRMWLVLVVYIVLAIALVAGLRFTGSSAGVTLFVLFMLALLVGLEAGTLRRFTLGRRGWKDLGVIVGDGRDAAERRFFEAWVPGETLPPLGAAPRSYAPGQPAPATPASDVIGLFPQPGTHR